MGKKDTVQCLIQLRLTHYNLKTMKSNYNTLLHAEWALDHYDLRLKEKVDLKIEHLLNNSDKRTAHIIGYYTDHTGAKNYWASELGKHFNLDHYVEWFIERADYLKASMYIKKAIVDSGIHPTQYKAGATVINIDQNAPKKSILGHTY